MAESRIDKQNSTSGSDLFIVDNSDKDWKVRDTFSKLQQALCRSLDEHPRQFGKKWKSGQKSGCGSM
ncbi:MAG: hypothetical protein ACERKY_11485, partial [Anaerolineales bacterium]